MVGVSRVARLIAGAGHLFLTDRVPESERAATAGWVPPVKAFRRQCSANSTGAADPAHVTSSPRVPARDCRDRMFDRAAERTFNFPPGWRGRRAAVPWAERPVPRAERPVPRAPVVPLPRRSGGSRRHPWGGTGGRAPAPGQPASHRRPARATRRLRWTGWPAAMRNTGPVVLRRSRRRKSRNTGAANRPANTENRSEPALVRVLMAFTQAGRPLHWAAGVTAPLVGPQGVGPAGRSHPRPSFDRRPVGAEHPGRGRLRRAGGHGGDDPLAQGAAGVSGQRACVLRFHHGGIRRVSPCSNPG